MQVLTLGAGTVGRWVADMLCKRGHSVTVVDTDQENVSQINSELDVRAMVGSAARSTVLFQADVFSADVCLAVTGNDEVNILAASMAKALGARRSIARVYAPAFQDLSTFDYQRHFNIDSLLSLEQLSAFELARVIQNPDAIPLEHFARGQLEVYEVEIDAHCSAADHKLRDIKLPSAVRIGSIARDGRMWIASGEDELHGKDRISLIGNPEAVAKSRELFTTSKERTPQQRVMIAGGGETGYHLADSLSRRDYRIVMLESDPDQCGRLSRLLPNATIIHANANRRTILEDEGAGTVDYFVACTGNDESNIMAGVEARELGADRVMCVVGRPDYANVVGKLGIDYAVSERDVTARQIIGYLNEGAVISQRRLPNGAIGVFELEVFEGAAISRATLAELPLAGRCLIAAIERDGFVRVPQADDQLEPGDIIVALIDPSAAEESLALFNP